MAPVPTVRLNNGLDMPIIGLGTYARKAEAGQYKKAVVDAVKCGYRHIDTAASYNNEDEVGAAINDMIKQNIVKREELFVTTKLWNDCHPEKDVVPALQKSLQRLNLDYVDLYLIHWPVSVDAKGKDMAVDYLETWKGMEEAVKLNLTKSIGVSNFNEAQLKRILDHAVVKPVVNQVEINPTLTQHRLVELCKSVSILPVAYTPFGLISDARPEFAGKDTIKTDPALGDIADKYKKTRAQIALRYLTQRGIPVIPKSFTPSRIEENLNVFDFTLTADEMATMDGYNLNHRCVPRKALQGFSNFPFE